ncbi:MAG: hypothetical protein PSX37_10010, partial [bacterium]|nr:hypothetical protein [bacterium]
MLANSISDRLTDDGITVIKTTRKETSEPGWLCTNDPQWASALGRTSLSRVVWAQGANADGSIADDG